jgi:hypothetical protein
VAKKRGENLTGRGIKKEMKEKKAKRKKKKRKKGDTNGATFLSEIPKVV